MFSGSGSRSYESREDESSFFLRTRVLLSVIVEEQNQVLVLSGRGNSTVCREAFFCHRSLRSCGSEVSSLLRMKSSQRDFVGGEGDGAQEDRDGTETAHVTGA